MCKCAYVLIHDACASNELISVSAPLLYTDSPFTLSLLILLSCGKGTFPQTIATLSHSMLHSPLFLFAHLRQILVLHTPDAVKSDLTPCHTGYSVCSRVSNGSTVHKCDFSPNHAPGLFLAPGQRAPTPTVLSDDNRLPRDRNPLPFQETGSFVL